MKARSHLVFLGLVDCRRLTQIYLWCQAGECGKEWAEVLPPRTIEMSGPGLLSRSMAWPVMLMQLWWSALMIMTSVITEGPVNTQSGPLPVSMLMSKRYTLTGIILIQDSFTATQDHDDICPR